MNYPDLVKIYLIFSDLTWPHTSTYPSIQPPIHPPIGVGVSADFKSLNRIEISQFIQVLLGSNWFGGYPLEGGVGGYAWVWGCGSVPCMHTCVHNHTCVLHHRVSPKGSNLHEMIIFNMYACACVHICVCVCMCETPLTPSPTHIYSPYPPPRWLTP